MTTDNADIVKELRLLAKAVLERAQPVLKLVAGSSPSGAQFVSAVESIASGENSDFAEQFNTQGSKLIAQLRGFLEDGLTGGASPEPAESDSTPTATLAEQASNETAARHAALDPDPARESIRQ